MKPLIFVTLLFFLQLSNAQKNGPYESYFENGQLKKVGQCENGKRIGDWKDYYSDGNLRREYSYTKGEKNKELKSYFKDGNIHFETKNEGGIYIRKCYFNSGKLEYEQQLENGYFKNYYKDGTLKVLSNYKDGQLHGLWTQYYPDSSKEWEVDYFEGYKQGEFKHYYANNSLKLKGIFKNGKKEGKESQYYENGQLEWVGKNKNHKRIKKWTHFDSKGSKIETINFKNGEHKKGPNSLKTIAVPDGNFERAPIYPGCKNYLSMKDSKKCMSRKISKFVSNKFNVNVVKNKLLTGKQRILVLFKINTSGEVQNVKAKARHPELEAEAIRVVNLLPQMIPGKQFGKYVTVPYSLPISVFLTQKKSTNKRKQKRSINGNQM